MAPSTTGTSAAAPSGPAASASHHAPRRSNVKTVLPVLPLPLVQQHRHRRAQPSVPSPTAAAHALKTNQPPPTSSPGPERPLASPSAAELDLPNIATLSVAANGTDTKTSDHGDGARNRSEDESRASPSKDAVQAPPATSSHHEPSAAGTDQVTGPTTTTTTTTSTAAREPLSTNRSTNALPAAAISSPGPFNGFGPAQHPSAEQPSRGKENIPPTTANGMMMSRPPFHHPHHPMHHPHPSEGSIMFGGFPDSNNTSPAPPSAGMYPPPGPMHFPGYPPLRYAPPPPHGPMARPVPMPMPSGTMAGYPAMMSFAPSTPKSFHGSQTSNTVDGAVSFEENGFHHQQPPPPMLPNDAGVNMESNGVFPPGGPGSARQSNFPRSHELAQMHQREAREYIELNFNNPETADCQLVVNFSGENADKPWRSTLHLFGHRLVLGFSPALRAHLRGAHHFGGSLTIAVDDPYLRNDILWACLASLYGRAIPDYPEPDFNIAAAYLAAGSFLQLGAITMKGTDDVIRLISGWEALDKACSLALGGAVHQFPGSQQHPTGPEFLHRYGHAAERIVEAAASYIIDNFPPSYALVRIFPRPVYSRIPAVPDVPQTSPITSPIHSNEASPAPGPPRSSGPRSSNRLLSQIKFGDVPLSETDTDDTEQSEPAGITSNAAAGAHLGTNALLSSVLVNLPFGALKHVMENNGLGNISGWITTQTRYTVVSQIIAERERRRLEALKAVAAGMAADPSVKARLGSPHPPLGGGADPWDILGWHEYLVGSDESPQIVRSWDPLQSEM